MKVLHVIPSLDPASGGPPMIAARFAAAQSMLGCEMEIVAYSFPDAVARIDTALRTIPNIERVKLHYLPPLTRIERLFAPAARKLEPYIRRFDFLHLHGVWDPIVYGVAAVARRIGKPYCVTLHGMLDPWSLTQKRLKKRAALLLGYRRMLNSAAFLHYGNADELRLTRNLDLKPPARIVPNGIFIEEIDPLPPCGAFRSEYAALNGNQIIAFMSRLHFKKGLDFLADAFALVAAEFPGAQLVVAGPNDGAEADFRARIARHGLQSRVHMPGPIYGPKKLALLRDCDCFCLPSRQEGFSMAVLEAMACEAPVVITPGCHFPEVGENGAGIIAELDSRSIADAIARILRDPDAARQIGRNARNLIVDRYTWPRLAEQLVEGYREAVGAAAVA